MEKTPTAPLGVVVSLFDTPNTNFFYFVIKNSKIKKGQFVYVFGQENEKIFGIIVEISWYNRYYRAHEEVADLSQFDSMKNFPVSEWEYGIGKVKIFGSIQEDKFEKCFFPPKCGTDVFLATKDDLNSVFKFEQNGLNLGKLLYHDVDVKLDFSKFIGKHLAILAMSGSGKSYFTSVLIEELLSLNESKISVVVFDSHRDYTFFADSNFKDNVIVVNAKNLKLNYLSLGSSQISEVLQIAHKGSQYLSSYFAHLKKQKKEGMSIPDLEELYHSIESDSAINRNTKEALLSSISHLKKFKFLSNQESFSIKNFKPGKLIIFDLFDIDDLQSKQLIVSYYLSKLFRARKKEKIPPILAIIEEAHNFCPEKQKASEALSRGIINTIAREGRKFFFSICLISQRPVHLSTTALSQCNTNVILKITNPYDLDHIKESAESIDSDSLSAIPSLDVGVGLISGEAAQFPFFVQIRKRKSYSLVSKEKTFAQAAKEYQEKLKQKQDALDAYLDPHSTNKDL